MLFNLNGGVERKVNKLDGVCYQQYICPRCGKTHIESFYKLNIFKILGF